MYHFSREYTQSADRWHIVWGPSDTGVDQPMEVDDGDHDFGYDQVGAVKIVSNDDNETYRLDIVEITNPFGHKLDIEAVKYEFTSFILGVIVSLHGTIDP